MNQPTLPEIPAVPSRRLLTELELQDIRKKIIESNGDITILGDNAIEIMRDVLYTCRMKADPLQDDPNASKGRRKKSEGGESTNRQSLKGIDVNNLLG